MNSVPGKTADCRVTSSVFLVNDGVVHTDTKSTTLFLKKVPATVFKNSNWRQQISRGLNASTPYTLKAATCDPGTCFSMSRGPLKNQISSCTTVSKGNLVAGLTADDANLKNAAAAILRSKIRSKSNEFASLVPLAELKETRGLIKQAGESSLKMVHALLQLKKFYKLKRYRRDLVRRASDVWLTFRFGIIPTLDDIDSGLKSINKVLQDSGGKMIRFTATQSRSFNGTGNSAGVAAARGLSISTGPAEYRHELSYRYIAGIRPQIFSGNSYATAKHLGFTPDAYLSAVWELVPFSWVVDYFTTAGEFFEDVFWTPPGSTVYLLEIKKHTYEGRHNFSHPISLSSPAYSVVAGGGGTAKCSVVNLSRSLGVNIPHVAFRVKTLDEIGYHSITKLLNLAAILGK